MLFLFSCKWWTLKILDCLFIFTWTYAVLWGSTRFYPILAEYQSNEWTFICFILYTAIGPGVGELAKWCSNLVGECIYNCCFYPKYKRDFLKRFGKRFTALFWYAFYCIVPCDHTVLICIYRDSETDDETKVGLLIN